MISDDEGVEVLMGIGHSDLIRFIGTLTKKILKKAYISQKFCQSNLHIVKIYQSSSGNIRIKKRRATVCISIRNFLKSGAVRGNRTLMLASGIFSQDGANIFSEFQKPFSDMTAWRGWHWAPVRCCWVSAWGRCTAPA